MAAYTAIDDPSAYFKVQIYTGDGSTQAVAFDDTDTNMQPDFVWIKNREEEDHNILVDSVRGVTETQYSNSNASDVDDDDTVTAFGSDGFTVGDDVKVNTNTEKYVAWCWKAGTTSGINTTGANTTPTTYSFNQTAGFSIIQYDGNGTDDTQIAHGLATVPHCIFVHNMDADDDGGVSWAVYHHKNTSAPETDFLTLDETYATADASNRWSDEAPTSVLFTTGSNSTVNKSSRDYIAYLWTGKQGYSKFGSYEGNGNADGTFVYTGFRPAYVMTKSSDSTSSWHIFDNKREGYNVDNDALIANNTTGSPGPGTAEATTDMIDILSNGFKCRIATDPNVAESYIYIAFAEAPFVNSNGVPCNAR